MIKEIESKLMSNSTAPEKLFAIIHEDNELLVINKLAGLVCHPTKTDEYSSLISRVRLYLATQTGSSGASPHLVNRLDRETSGVTVVAKQDEPARELRRLWESRQVEKEYLAIVHGHVREESGVVDAPLGKDEASRVAIKDCVRPDGLPSQTEFFVEKRFERNGAPSTRSARTGLDAQRAERVLGVPFTLLRVHPLTGRKHQIRIHLAHVGHPVVGDKLYGGDEDLYLALVENRLTDEQRRRLIFRNHALHAQLVRFVWRGRAIEFRCEPEEWFQTFLSLNE
jgi:23S rRNA pseudouridine1911/1915/1917 synthase